MTSRTTTALLCGLVTLAACTDVPTSSRPRAASSHPSRAEITPPPPPLDGDPSGVLACVRLPEELVAKCVVDVTPFLRARILANPAGTAAFLDLSSTNPLVTVSPNARIRQTQGGLVGQGTITLPLALTNIAAPPGAVAVVDLATATGVLTSDIGDWTHAIVGARITYLDGSPIIVPGPAPYSTWWWSAAFSFRY